MATIKSYTDIPQSKKLAEILPIKSADMYYKLCDITKVWHPYLLIGYDDLQAREDLFNLKQYNPCWSLAALLGVLPNENMLVKTTDGEYYCLAKDVMTKHYDNSVDACYEMIQKLHELKML